MKRTFIRAIAALSLTATAAAAQLGPINPPGGPVSDTGPHLGEIEPRIAINAQNTPGDANSFFRITSSGSYYLTGDLFGSAAGFSVIEVAVSDVVIDLNGYRISGSSSAFGIFGSNTEGVTVKNGRIRSIGGPAISLNDFSNTVQDVRVLFADGIILGPSATVENVNVGQSDLSGITVGQSSSVRDTRVSSITGDGFNIGASSVVERCTASSSAIGFDLSVGAQAVHCTAFNNSGNGFNGAGDNIIEACIARNCNEGVLAGAGCVIRNGVFSLNDVDGIDVDAGCHVEGNVVRGNGNDGICARASNTIVNNTVDNNTGSGILLLDQANRVDSNNLSANQVNGIRTFSATAIDNTIIRNSARANIPANYSIVAGNFFVQVSGATTNNYANISQ
ncbi:MAG: right-handed parallel beta-helix repeat-containing protein [Planctomycetota bacterium]